jgi:hypothetical protein
MPSRRHPLAFVVVACCLTLPAGATAQVRASERGAVTQTIDGTVITIDYARPQVRGRSPIFGGFVKWKEVWTPGANFATTLETNRPLLLDGHPVPPGKYSMWLVVGQEEWIAVLDPRPRLYHTTEPDSTPQQIRWVVHPGQGPFTEALTFTFPEVKPSGGTLLLRWGNTELPIKVSVQPKHRLTLSAADAAPYLGDWTFRWTDQADSVPSTKIRMVQEDGVLIAHWTPEAWEGAGPAALVRIAPDWFDWGLMEKGELVDMMSEFVFEFNTTGGKATSFEIRGDADKLFGVGKRQ